MRKQHYLTSVKNKKIKNTQKKDNDLYTIILICDNPGYRMKSYGPTCLIDLIKNKKLLDLQVDVIKKIFDNFEIIICAGFDVDKISKYVRSKYKDINIRIVENQLFENTGPCESIRLAINNTNNNKIFILDGGLIFEKNIFNHFNFDISSILLEEYPCENLEIGANINENKQVEHLSFGGHKIWSEILYLNNEMIIESLRKIINSAEYKRKFIFEALNELLKTNNKLSYHINKTKINKISNIKTYHKIRKTNEIFDR